MRARTCFPPQPLPRTGLARELSSASSGSFHGSRRAMPASSTIHVLQVLRELLAFVLLSYTVLIGALLLAGWTTYFLVLK